MKFNNTIVLKKAKKAPVLKIKRIRLENTEKIIGYYFKPIIKFS